MRSVPEYSVVEKRQTHTQRLRRPPSKDKPFVAAITAPLGILLPAGLVLHVDEKELVRLPLRFCNVNDCQGQFPINASMQKLFMDGEKGRVVFRQPNGRPLRVEFSLKGFAEGFTKLSAD